MNNNQKSNYILGLDGLRAVAVLAVLFYHLRLPYANGGPAGVTVFFVLSGYLTVAKLVQEYDNNGRISVGRFWVKRVRRLLPSVVTMASVTIFLTAIFKRVLFTKAVRELVSVIFCFSNYRQILSNASYFQNQGAPSPFTHCWSLGVEVQFYILIPLLMILLLKFADRKWAGRVLLFLGAISAILMIVLFKPAEDPTRIYYGIDTRLFSFLFGGALAIYGDDERLNRVPDLYREILGGAGLLLLLVMMIFVKGGSPFMYRGGHLLITIFCMLYIYGVTGERTILGKVMSIAPFRWLANISFALYLWHYPVIIFISGGMKSSVGIVILEIALSFALAILSYYVIEMAFKNKTADKYFNRVRRAIPELFSGDRTRQHKALKKLRGFIVFLVFELVVICFALFMPRREVSTGPESGKKVEKGLFDDTVKAATKAGQYVQGRTPDDAICKSKKILYIGDSISVGASDWLYEAFPEMTLDGEVGRTPMAGVDVLAEYLNVKGWTGDAIVFELASNMWLQESLDEFYNMLPQGEKLFLVTCRAPYTDWQDQNNAEIYDFAETHQNVYVIDWYGISNDHSEYFAEDATHMSMEGIEVFVEEMRIVVTQAFKTEE